MSTIQNLCLLLIAAHLLGLLARRAGLPELLGQIASGCIARTRRTGLDGGRSDSRGVAILMNTRGVMATVAAGIALRSGLIEARLYTPLLTTAILATIVTLLLMRPWLQASVGVARPAL